MLRRRTKWKDIMAKDQLQEVEEPDGDIDALDEDALDDDALEEVEGETEDDDVLEEVADEDAEDDEAPVAPQHPAEDEDDEVPDADDVEASLDVILKERLVVEDEVEDDEAVEVDDRGDATERVLPKQDDEFVCNSCFLVKSITQLANKKKGFCRDCA